MKIRAVVVLAAVVLGTGAPAGANGRFPASASVTVRPGHPEEIALGLTFGLALTHDGGASWYWMCEQSIGYGGSFDPIYRIGPDGTLYATTFNGLRVSRDGGCTWATATPSNVWVDALSLGSDGSVWIGTSQNGASNDVYRSTDAGMTFQPMGLASPTIWWNSVEVSPSDPMRIYVTGYQLSPSVQVFVERSDDGGQSWTPMPLDSILLAPTPQLLLLGVDPSNPDLVYLRSMGANGAGSDLVYRSADGAQHWAHVVESSGALTGFAIRSTGDVIAGSQNAPDQLAPHGCVYRSTDSGATFGVCEAGPKLACVADRGDGTLLGCGTNWDPDYFALGTSTDGLAWTKMFRFDHLTGPVHCASGTVQYDTCEEQLWRPLTQQFGIGGSVDAGVPPPDAGIAETGGAGGCCGTSDGGGTVTVVLAFAVLAVLHRRRTTGC